MMMILVYCLINFTVFQYAQAISGDAALRSEPTEEVQHAVCKIMHGEFEAAANATITRQLKGVCTSSELAGHIQDLRNEILQQFEIIKVLLLQKESDYRSTLPVKVFSEQDEKQPKYKTTEPVSEIINSSYFNYGRKLAKMKTLKNIANTNQKNKTLYNMTVVEHDFVCDIHNQDIKACNNTIQPSVDGNIFIYYWKIANINKILVIRNIYIKSADFFVLGHQMQLQLYPNHLGTRYVGIQLRPVTNFHKSYQITVINTSDMNMNIQSQIIQDQLGEVTMYKIENDKLRKICQDNILILRCTILLDS